MLKTTIKILGEQNKKKQALAIFGGEGNRDDPKYSKEKAQDSE
jgi:hypothetical protein